MHAQRLFFLGAGFSRAAGLPLSDELLDLVIDQVRRSTEAVPTKLDKSIARYRTYVTATTGKTPDKLNFEDFATYLDHEHILGLRGSDTWSDEGNEDQLMLRWGIGAVLNRMTLSADKIPPLYLDFARRLRGGDIVVSFNYDLLLERSLDAVGVKHRRFPSRYIACYPTYSVGDSDREWSEVLLLKVHGSIDWVNRARYHRDYELPRPDLDEEEQRSFRERDIVFGGSACTPTKPLVEGPRPEGDPLSDVYVLEDPDAFYAEFSAWWHTAPLVLPPSQAKIHYGAPLREFWRGMIRDTTAWGTLAVIGYSLPQGDPYTKQVLHALSSGHSYALDHPELYPWTQSRITVVDYQPDDIARQRFMKTYRFLDGEHTDFHFGGLSSKSVAYVFAGS